MTNIAHGNIDDYHMPWSIFQVLYLILDATFLEVAYIPIFYWLLKDVGVMLNMILICFIWINK